LKKKPISKMSKSIMAPIRKIKVDDDNMKIKSYMKIELLF